MASGFGSRAEEHPPALPVKQHRHSSVESDSSVGPQHQNYAFNDVFSDPTDCHAAQCPIHQRYDPSKHQVRFFSDGTPPPVPKKRLARTLSLPGTNAPSVPSLSPLSPLQRHAQYFDNAIYMMAPIPDSAFHEEAEENAPERQSPVPSLSFPQLSFDTQDENLSYIFSDFVDQRAISQGIQHCHLLFLRTIAKRVEARSMLQGEASGRDVSSYQPQDFLLCEESKPKQIGDMIYYSLHSPVFPGRLLGLRVLKQADVASSAHIKHQPAHVNVQDVIALFHPFDNNISRQQDPTAASVSLHSTEPPGGSSTGYTTLQSLLLRGHSVSVERDLPYATLQDFVQDSRSLHSTMECLDYDRRVCVLLLQILMGAHHLYSNSATAAELRPQEILLVWPSRGQAFKTSREQMEWENSRETERIQMLWRTQGSPRVVLKPQSSAVSVSRSTTSIKLQIGALIQFCLQKSPDSAAPASSYRRGLLHMSSMLQRDSDTQMTDMVAMLQVLLWGPRVPPMSQRSFTDTTMHNWLTVKRALLVMKFADKGLFQDQSALDWEDCMCLQYLSFTDTETLVSTTSQLWHTLS